MVSLQPPATPAAPPWSAPHRRARSCGQGERDVLKSRTQIKTPATIDGAAGAGAATADPQRTGPTPGLQQGRQLTCLRRDHAGNGCIRRLRIEQIRHAHLAPLRRIGSSHSISGPNVLTDLSTAGSEDRLGIADLRPWQPQPSGGGGIRRDGRKAAATLGPDAARARLPRIRTAGSARRT